VRNPNVHYHVHNSQPLLPTVSQINPLHFLPPICLWSTFNIILAFTPRPSNCSLPFSRSHQNLVNVSPPCAQHDRPISIGKYMQNCSIRHPALSAILCTNSQHGATWRKYESVCVTLLHLPTVRRRGVTRVRPSVALFFLPSLFVMQSQRSFLIPLTHFVSFLMLVQSVCLCVSSLHSRIVNGTKMLH